jgi:phospholipid/cholesterol/gamma-HCH transport system ATP-binding protein
MELHDVQVVLRQQEVLRSITLTIPRGQTLAIIGESGCGKTVFLKTLIGLIPPTAGEVYFDGRNLQKLSDKDLTEQRLRFGFVFQNAALFDSMTIGQNIAFPLRQEGGRSEEQVRQAVLSLLTEVGLAKSVITKKPAELSGGMRKRVGIARALATNPELMLYDEPTTGLDPIMSDVINQLITRTRERHGVTSVVVTHNMPTVWHVADRVVMLYPLSLLRDDEPQILFDGTPEELRRSTDRRVSQFVEGRAEDRLLQLSEGG